MGAKAGILAFTDGDISVALREPMRPDRDEMEVLVRQVLPGYGLESVRSWTLGDAVCPDDDVIFAGAVGATTILCDKRFMMEPPSTLPPHVVDLADGRRIVLFAQHSTADWLGFAIWDRGELVRSLSLSPSGGITENIGEPLSFEQPYWAGEHPIGDDYPLPFHPLSLAMDAVYELFGFILEGRPRGLDPFEEHLRMHGFRATDPSGAEQAQRDAIMAAARQMRLARRSTYVDGQLVEIERP